MNLVQIQERLKDLPTQALMSYANGQNPQVPPYLALGELNRRKQMEQQAAQPPKGTVKDSIEQQVGLMQLQKLRQGQMAQQSAMQGANAPTIPQGTPEPMEQSEGEMAMAAGGLTSLPVHEMNFGSGGIIAFAGGGDEGEELSKAEAKAILKRMKQREGTEPRDVIEAPPENDVSIPGFEAGRRTQELVERTPRRMAPTPQQIEANVNVERPDLASQIPGQSVAAPASTGRMPTELERNINNTMNALPGASASRGFTGGLRGLLSLIGAAGNAEGTTSPAKPVSEGIPSMGADQNLGEAIMAQATQRANAAAPSGIVTSAGPGDRMVPRYPAGNVPSGIAAVAPPAPRPQAVGQRPVAPAPAPAKSAAQLFQEKLLSGEGLPALPGEYAPPKQAPIGEEYMKYLSDREQKRREDALKVQDVEAGRAKRDFFNALIAGGEATRGQKGIGSLFSGTGRALGESMTAAEERALAFQEKQQQLADNDAKTRYEIDNLRRAEERGDSKAVYESKLKIAELNTQRGQLQGQVANAMAQNESTERIARQNNITQLEVARIHQATAGMPDATERIAAEYARRKAKDPADAEEYMKTIERAKFGNKPQIAAEANAIKRLALAEKDDNYKMQARIADDPKQKPEARARAQEIMRAIEVRNGIVDSGGSDKVMTMADVKATAASSGRTEQQVIDAAKARGYTIQ